MSDRNANEDLAIRESLRKSHTEERIRDRLQSPKSQVYLRDFIYGAIDGAVTTFAVVSGVAGAELSSSIIIVLGLANLLGDGFSMAAGNFLGVRAEEQLRESARRMEHHHIRHFPEGEREEIRQIFAEKGFEGEDLERAVNVITSDVERWVNTMLQDEHGLALEGPSAVRAAGATFVAFIVIGAIPLAPFVIALVWPAWIPRPFLISSALTGAAFFAVGAAKSRFVKQSWWAAGLETTAVGGAAAALAYWVGVLLRDVV